MNIERQREKIYQAIKEERPERAVAELICISLNLCDEVEELQMKDDAYHNICNHCVGRHVAMQGLGNG